MIGDGHAARQSIDPGFGAAKPKERVRSMS